MKLLPGQTPNTPLLITSTNEYVGLKLGRLVEVDLSSNALLVRADLAQAQLAKAAQPSETTAVGPTAGDERTRSPLVERPCQPDAPAVPQRPRRFYAKVALDPNRPTPQMSNIAQSILAELDRVRGATITLTLDIDAEVPSGFPDDVQSVVRDNARDLHITDFGFEEE